MTETSAVNSKRIYLQRQVDEVLELLDDGVTPADAASRTGIPYTTIRAWKSNYNHGERTQVTRRAAFVMVMTHYNSIRETLGNTRATDYAQMTGGGRAQYARDDTGHKLIEFTVDVDHAAKACLNDTQRRYFDENIVDKGDLVEAMEVQTDWFMRLQARLGRVFIERGIFPVSDYFVTKKGDN